MADRPKIFDRESDRDTATVTKEQANYRYQGGVAGRSCGDCHYFEAGLCTRGVIGIDRVDAGDVCDEFRSSLQDGSMSAQEAEAVLSHAGAYRTMDMFITKVVRDRQSGVRRWFATSSGIKRDQYNERMSVELFDDFIRRIEEKEKPPEMFMSSAWQGGLPYLGVAHYLDLDGFGIAGDTEQVWRDRTVFKAKGTFRDTPLADASYNAIDNDIKNRVAPENRVRVSIAFVDWGHEHEGQGHFERKSLIDRCGYCEQDIGEKIYRKGHLVHFAQTRRPAYLETEIQLEARSMTKSKRQDDATSIVGEELADEMEAKSADDLTERAEGEGIDPSAIVIRQDEEAAPPEDCEGLEGDELAKCLERKRARSEGAEAPEGPAVMASLGGAKSLDEADEFLARSKGGGLLDSWAVMASVLTNIAGEDRKEEVTNVVNDFQSRLDVMALKAILNLNDLVERASEEEPVVEKQLPPMPEECQGLGGDELADCLKKNKGQEGEPMDETVERIHPLDEALEAFRSSFDAVMEETSTDQERLQKLQEPFVLFGEAVRKSVAEPEIVGGDVSAVVKAVSDVIAPLYQKLALIEQKVAAGVVERTVPSAPVRRSLTLPPATGAEVRRFEPSKPRGLREIIRNSVGLQS